LLLAEQTAEQVTQKMAQEMAQEVVEEVAANLAGSPPGLLVHLVAHLVIRLVVGGGRADGPGCKVARGGIRVAIFYPPMYRERMHQSGAAAYCALSPTMHLPG